MSLPKTAFRRVAWREASKAALSSRLAALRVRAAHRDPRRQAPRPPEWLVIEYPAGEDEPGKYRLSTLPADTPLTDLLAAAKGRWRIERDYQELKQELGLGHHEGRGWRGFHHHTTLCIAAYGFLVAEQSLFPPDTRFRRHRLKAPAIPKDHQPRGAAGASGAPQPHVHRLDPTPHDPQLGQATAPRPLLPHHQPTTIKSQSGQLVTQ